MAAPAKESNKDYMKAADNSLRSIAYQYADFMPKKLPLMPSTNWRRYWVHAHALPDHICKNLNLKGRYCVQLPDGKTELEVTHDIANADGKKLLAQVIDGGSIGWASKWFMFDVRGAAMRGDAMHDPCHKRYDHFKTTVWAAGLKGVWADMKVLTCLYCVALRRCQRHDISMHRYSPHTASASRCCRFT